MEAATKMKVGLYTAGKTTYLRKFIDRISIVLSMCERYYM